MTAFLSGMIKVTGSAAVLVLDIDGFTAINAALGHEAGDVLLRTVAARMASRIEAPALVGTLGADSFGVVLPDANAARAQAVAQTLLDAVVGAVDVAGHEIEVEASVGAAISPE
ncbi:MAG: GGDEF domain-containing protein, partial [Candidatus Rokubacteria bacterium]|nr:GGDEF domain-containing protein [Candidatus Rokubacteria bacterium]